MSKILPANRTASLSVFITGLAGCATALAGVYPNPATNEIALILGGTATIAGPLSHVIGSWLWDKRMADVNIAQLQLEQHKVYADNMNTVSNANASVEDVNADFTNTDENNDLAPDPEERYFTGTIDLGPLGPLKEDHNPEHSLAPENATDTDAEKATDTGPEIQKSVGEA